MTPQGIECKFNETELSLHFPGRNSRIELKGADNEDSLRGAGLDGMVIDEFASILDSWSVWHEVLRPALTDKKGWVIFISTPKGKDAFYDLWLKGYRKDPGWDSWKFTTRDNPYIDPEEVDEAEASSPTRYFRQEFLASFEDFEGKVYPEFNEKKHVIAPFHLPREYPRIAAIDPAISGTTAVLKMAVDDDGRLIAYEEYYEKDKRVEEVVKSIKEKGVRWFIDPASASKNIIKEGKLFSIWNEYQEKGITATPGENDVEGGINRVAEYFKNDRILIFKNCTNLIWELERYHWAEQKETRSGVTKPRPFKKNDHLCDALRYLVMSRPQEADMSRPFKIPKGSVAWFMERDEEEARDWKKKYELKENIWH